MEVSAERNPAAVAIEIPQRQDHFVRTDVEERGGKTGRDPPGKLLTALIAVDNSAVPIDEQPMIHTSKVGIREVAIESKFAPVDKYIEVVVEGRSYVRRDKFGGGQGKSSAKETHAAAAEKSRCVWDSR